MLVVAALLLTGQTGVAVAAETDEHKSENARKAELLLAQLGIDNAELLEFADYVSQKIDDGRLHIAEDRRYGGQFQLQYRLSGGIGAEQLELHYTPDDSNLRAMATPRSLRVEYKLSF